MNNFWLAGVRNTTVTFALANGANATVAADQTNHVVVTGNYTISKCWAVAKTAPTGADLIIDVHVNGTTIWSTQANRITILANATSGSQTSFNTTALNAGDVLSIDVDQVGSTIPGTGITVELVMG
jgi:hypothetical protein